MAVCAAAMMAAVLVAGAAAALSEDDAAKIVDDKTARVFELIDDGDFAGIAEEIVCSEARIVAPPGAGVDYLVPSDPEATAEFIESSNFPGLVNTVEKVIPVTGTPVGDLIIEVAALGTEDEPEGTYYVNVWSQCDGIDEGDFKLLVQVMNYTFGIPDELDAIVQRKAPAPVSMTYANNTDLLDIVSSATDAAIELIEISDAGVPDFSAAIPELYCPSAEYLPAVGDTFALSRAQLVDYYADRAGLFLAAPNPSPFVNYNVLAVPLLDEELILNVGSTGMDTVGFYDYVALWTQCGGKWKTLFQVDNVELSLPAAPEAEASG